MNDRNLMENILLLEKGVCDLLMHGSIESSTGNVNQTFRTSLSDALTMQDHIYARMSEKGWYQAEQADASKVGSVRQKFSAKM